MCVVRSRELNYVNYYVMVFRNVCFELEFVIRDVILVNPSRVANSANSACARIVRVRCRSRTVRSRIYQLADRHHYACTHIKFIKIRSFERACGPAEVGYSEQVARIRCISMRPTVSPRARIWACAVKPDLLEHVS